MKKTLACIVALALAAGMLAACGQGGSSVSTPPQGGAGTGSSAANGKDYHFIYVTPAGANAYWVDVQDGIDAAARDLGVTVETVGPDDVDQIKQIEAMEAAAVDKPDGIMTMALNPGIIHRPRRTRSWRAACPWSCWTATRRRAAALSMWASTPLTRVSTW